MSEKRTIIRNLAEYAITSAALNEYIYKNESPQLLVRNGIFILGQFINEYYIKKKEFFNVFENEKTNDLLKTYLFALGLQVFLDSLLINKEGVILQDIIDVSLVYSLNFIFDK